MASANASKKILPFLLTLSTTAAVPTVPTLAWWYWATQERAAWESEENQYTFRSASTSIETIDDQIVDKMRPGDLIFFNRKCHLCSSSPFSALSCYAAKYLIGANASGITDASQVFEHVAIVVEKKHNGAVMLEACDNGDGLVKREVTDALCLDMSKSVQLVRLLAPGERRTPISIGANGIDDDDSDSDGNNANGNSTTSSASSPVIGIAAANKSKQAKEKLAFDLQMFANKVVEEGKSIDYASLHNSMGLVGAIRKALRMDAYYFAGNPHSPSAWLVIHALQEAGAATKTTMDLAQDATVDDLYANSREILRTGWRLEKPVSLREK
jgi:hypothetical protein